MKLRWLIKQNTNPEDNSIDTRTLQIFRGAKEGQEYQQAIDDDSNWEDIEEVYL